MNVFEDYVIVYARPRRVVVVRAVPRRVRNMRTTAMTAIRTCARATTMTATTSARARRGAATRARAKRGFMSEIEDMKREGEDGSSSPSKSVEWSEPLAIAKYPAPCLRAANAPIVAFDDSLEALSRAMFKIMYETVGCGLAAPQVGVNYRLMVYNEAGEPGKGREVVLCNPKIVKFSKEKDFFEEGCLSFPQMYADVEVGVARDSARLFSFERPLALNLAHSRACERLKHKYTLIRDSSRVMGRNVSNYARLREIFEEDVRRARLEPTTDCSFPPSQRPIGVQIEAQNLKGKKFKMTLEGFEARVFQHEYDHLDGVLYHDRMSPEVRSTVQNQLDGFVAAYPSDEKAL